MAGNYNYRMSYRCYLFVILTYVLSIYVLKLDRHNLFKEKKRLISVGIAILAVVCGFSLFIQSSRFDNSLKIKMFKPQESYRKYGDYLTFTHSIRYIKGHKPEGYSEDKVEQIEVEVNPENPEMGKRTVEFSRELYIEEDDFMEDAPKKYFRLSPGREVRLKSAYYVTCTSCEKDEDGNIIAVHCTYDPETRGGDSPDGRKVKGTIHFVSAAHAIDAEVRLYDRLFTVENPSDETGVNDFTDNLNKDSMIVLKNAKLESNLTNLSVGDKFQFLRLGYFCVDKDSTPEKPVFNRTVALKDSWKKINK